ncbi:MAG TPA: M28 family metallopeptidase, partial [Capillimicrobium sp.]
MTTSSPVTPKLLLWALGAQLLLGGALLWQAATDFSLFRDDDGGAPAPAMVAALPEPSADRFDARRAMRWARRQVALGPRPAGSPAQRRAAAFLRPALPAGRFVPIPGTDPPLRNIVGELPGRGEPVLVVAHYDTTAVPGYLGANNSAAGVGAVIEIARSLRRDHDPERHRPVHFLLTDGEEPPTWPPERSFYDEGLRGSKFAAQTMEAGEVIVLDFVAQKGLSIPREENSDPALWARLRAAAERVGAQRAFPDETRAAVLDDHVPFTEQGIPAIDLIDFDYPCWQKPCDTMDKLSRRSLDASGETVVELVRELRAP